MGKATIRKDALRSRRAILDAAHQLIADGGEPSFAEIADAAGVGQATVYRHFENRQDMLAALAEEGMTRVEETAAAMPVDAGSFEQLLRLMAAGQVREQTLLAAIRRGEIDPERVKRLFARPRALFGDRLVAAQEAGLVRPELDIEDVMSVLAMLDGALAAVENQSERGEAAERVLELLFEGLRAK